MEKADWVILKLFPRGLVAIRLRQSADPVTLQTTMQRRTRQMRDRRLQSVETVVEWQERVPPEGDDHRFFFQCQDCRLLRFGARREVGDR